MNRMDYGAGYLGTAGSYWGKTPTCLIMSISLCRSTRTGISTILLPSIPRTCSLCQHNEKQEQNLDPLPHHALALLCM